MEEFEQAARVMRKTRHQGFTTQVRIFEGLKQMYENPEREELGILERDNEGFIEVQLSSERNFFVRDLTYDDEDEEEEIYCAGEKANGDPCQNTVDTPGSYCTWHEDQKDSE